MKTLDRTKDFGTIMGDVHGRLYEQGGTFFKPDGTEWTPADSPVEANNAEAAMRARLEADVAKKSEAAAAKLRAEVEAETRAKIEAEFRENAEAELRAKIEAEIREKIAAEASANGGGSTDTGTALEVLGLTSKVEGALRGAKIETVEALAACTEQQLLDLPNVGDVAVAAIKKALKGAGKKLAG
jgi:DNA-directed RNA polymerase alpha subunit